MSVQRVALSTFAAVEGQMNDAGQSLWDIVLVSKVELDDWPVIAEKLTFDEAVAKMRLLGAEHGMAKVFMWPHWAYTPELNDEVHMQIERAEFNRMQAIIEPKQQTRKGRSK